MPKQYVFICTDKEKRVYGVYSSLELAKDSWRLSYYKITKNIVFLDTSHSSNLQIREGKDFRVVIQGICDGLILETEVYDRVEHL
jgi:hypothetical protein